VGLDLHAEQKGHYLLITVTGVFDLASAKDLARRSAELCKARQQSSALVDCRNVSGVLSTIERYDYATFVAELHARYAIEHGAPLRVAYVGNEPLIDSQRFGETVAVNRGALVKVTTDMREALAWLSGETKTGPA
jgi:hypothetical protein